VPAAAMAEPAGNTMPWQCQQQRPKYFAEQLEQQVQPVWVSNRSKCKQFEAADEGKLHARIWQN